MSRSSGLSAHASSQLAAAGGVSRRSAL